MDVMTYEEKQKMTHADLVTLVAELQEHVLILSDNVKQLKKITGWSSGYDDHNWPIEKSLTERIEELQALAWNTIYDTMVQEHYKDSDEPFKYNKVADRIIIALKNKGLLDV